VCGIYLIFCAQFSYDLVTLNLFDLDGVSYTKLHMPNAHSSFEPPMIIHTWVMDDSVPSHATASLCNTHVPCHMSDVTYHQGTKIVHILKIPDPNISAHFQGTMMKIKPCYRRKIAFIPLWTPLWRLQSSLCMHSISIMDLSELCMPVAQVAERQHFRSASRHYSSCHDE